MQVQSAPAVTLRGSGALPGTARGSDLLRGLALAVAVALVATLGGHYFPLVGGPVLAILLGVAVRSRFVPGADLRPGIAFAGKTVLQSAIIVSGFGLSFVSVVRTGVTTLPVTLATVIVALGLAPLLGRLLRVDGVLRTLIGVGTAICGASAIVAVASVIEPEEGDLALAIATIFLYNVAAVLLFPSIGHLMHLSQLAFGLWAGTAINDTSSVVAAGYVYGHAAGTHATIVKLTRATLILPIVAVIAAMRVRAHRRSSASTRIPWRRIVPWFIAWFLVAAVINSSGIIPMSWHGAIGLCSVFLITVALGAIGLQTELRKLIGAGVRPLGLGFALWAAVAATSLAVQRATGL